MSILLKNLEKRETNKGVGIFTKTEIPSNTVVLEFEGDLLEWNEIPFPLTEQNDKYLQIGKSKFLGPSARYDDYINHSCSPNCYVYIVGRRAFLKSLFLIKANCEITFDYSLTSTNSKDEWLLNCKCGNFGCRNLISGFKYLDDKTKNNYIKLNIVPDYVK